MVFPRMRAWVFGILFVAWLGYLASLVVENHNRILIAGPQIARSNLVVVASLADDGGRPAADVKIKKVLFAEKNDWQKLVGETMELDELLFYSAKQGWNGPGDYVLPLTRRAFDKLVIDQITPLPLSPGYYPAASNVTLEVGKNPQDLANRVASLTGASSKRLRNMFNVPIVMLVNVGARTVDEQRSFADQVRQMGGEVKAFQLSESRIYPATPDVLGQIERLSR